jgi:enoyl-CoA hydratase
MSSDLLTDAAVLVRRRGRLGELTLNRPARINALDPSMIEIVRRRLDDWAEDPGVASVLIRGAGERGLCAGGDVVTLSRRAADGDVAPAGAFWRQEYLLSAVIDEFPKPYVAFMDGIVLGGGVGISAHGSHRIVTERTRLGMPETVIGFVPDVGVTHLLARAPGELGTHAALTGEMISGADAIALGLADHWVPSERLVSLVDSLASEDASTAIAAVAEPAPPSGLAEASSWIDAAYAGDDLAEIMRRLADGEEPAQRARAALAARAPLALAVTLRSMRIAAQEPDLRSALRREYRTSMNMVRRADFPEGVRAQVIDKDRAPRWRPADLADVTPAMVDAALAPIQDELMFPGEGDDVLDPADRIPA